MPPMRNLDELIRDKKRHEDLIAELQAEDDQFPNERIYGNAIGGHRGAVSYLDRRIREIIGDV